MDSIKRANIIINIDNHRLSHIELKVWLGDAGAPIATHLTIFVSRRHGSFQIELSRVLILRGGWMVNSDDRTLVETKHIVLLVAQLRVIRCVDWWRSARRNHLGLVLMLVTCINRQGLNSPIVSDDIGGRYHRVLLRICWRQVVHLQRGDLGKVSDDLLILLTVLDTGYYKSERLLSDFFHALF